MLSSFFSASSCRMGFTRRELLFGLAVLIAAVIVVTGPVSQYLAQSRIAHAVQKGRELNLLLSQYALDNDDTYPIGQGTTALGKSEGIARNLLNDKYASTPDIFVLGKALAYTGTAVDFSDFAANQIDWDFTAATSTTGLPASAPGLLPTLYATGETVSYPAATGTVVDLTLSGNGPFGLKGMVVGYKNNAVIFIPATPIGSQAVAKGFILPAFPGGSYTQIKP